MVCRPLYSMTRLTNAVATDSTCSPVASAIKVLHILTIPPVGAGARWTNVGLKYARNESVNEALWLLQTVEGKGWGWGQNEPGDGGEGMFSGGGGDGGPTGVGMWRHEATH